MQHNIIYMILCPSTRSLRTVATALCIIGLALPSLAAARDASIQYRSSPGFQCNRWNASNECADWSYYDYGYNMNSAPVYRGSTLYRRNISVTPVRQQQTGMRCGNATIDCTGSVSVRVRGMPNPVSLGELLTYTLYVRNDDSQIRSVEVRAYIDENTDFDSATYGGYQDGEVIRWDALRIPARSSRSFTMRVRVRSHASTGTPLKLTVRADQSIDTASVNVLDAGYYSNAYRVLDDGTYVNYNRYSGERRLQVQPIYYRDRYGNVMVR